MLKVVINLINRLLYNRLAVFAFFVFIALFFYYNSIDLFFMSDDFNWLEYGEIIKNDVTKLITLKVTTFYSLTVNLFFFIGQSLFPFQYKIYHVVLLLIHALNGYLVFSFSKKLTKNHYASILGAIYFLTTIYGFEAKVWAGSVLHILVTTFVLLASINYLSYCQNTKNRKIYYVLFIICSLLAFLTKENGIIIFALVPTLYIYLNKKNKKRLFEYKNFKHLIPYFFIALGIGISSYIIQHNTYWVEQGIYIIDYQAALVLLSSILALVWEPWARTVVQNPALMSIYFILLFLFSVLVLRRKYFSEFLLGLCIISLGFAPVIFFYFGSWLVISQNRYAYLPSIGMAFIISLFFARIFEYKQKIVSFLFIVIMGLYVTLNYIHTQINFEEYYHINRQTSGMISSFTDLKDKIDQSNKIVLIQSYPFEGNLYYKYLYKYFVSDAKEDNDWANEVDWDTAFEKYNQDNNLLLIWNDRLMQFVVVNDSVNQY